MSNSFWYESYFVQELFTVLQNRNPVKSRTGQPQLGNNLPKRQKKKKLKCQILDSPNSRPFPWKTSQLKLEMVSGDKEWSEASEKNQS